MPRWLCPKCNSCAADYRYWGDGIFDYSCPRCGEFRWNHYARRTVATRNEGDVLIRNKAEEKRTVERIGGEDTARRAGDALRRLFDEIIPKHTANEETGPDAPKSAENDTERPPDRNEDEKPPCMDDIKALYASNGMSNEKIHLAICTLLTGLYKRKNHDYGDAFSVLRREYPTAICYRLTDKLSRLKTLMQPETTAAVSDESIEDTLIDIANYAIMELIERVKE